MHLGLARAQLLPRSDGYRRFTGSPIDALVYLVGLSCQIPIRLALRTIIHRRVAALPQRWPACRGDVRGGRLHPDVVQDVADFGAVGDEGNDAHLPSAHRTWGTAAEMPRRCGQSAPPTSNAPLASGVLQVRVWVWPRCPAPPPQVRPRQVVQSPPWLVATQQAEPAPLPPLSAASLVPAHQSSGAGGCVAVAPARRCGRSVPAV